MKKQLFTFLMTIFVSSQSYAGAGTSLIAALNSAIDEASVEFEMDTTEAFKVIPESAHEVLVAFKAGANVHEYGCHYHGSDMACHAEDDHHLTNKSETEANFSHILEGYEAALVKLKKTLARRGSDLNALKSIKVWKLEKEDDHDDGHEHGADVWTKVTYDMNNKEVTVFVQCHEHEEKSAMACHYKRSGKSEPTL